MTPELSLRLFKEGATFIFTNVPAGTEVGIDLQCWNTGHKFQGIKMIPPGIHFIYFSAVSSDHQNTAPRTGFFHCFRKGEVLVKKYDRRNEDISLDEVPVETLEQIKGNLETLDKSLGSYPYDVWRKWVSLTNKITVPVLEKLSPPNGRILSAPELILDADQSIPISCGKRLTKLEQAEEALPRMSEVIESKIRYSKIPLEQFPVGATASEITKSQLDGSWKLNKVLQTMNKPEELLAELQFTFVNFLVGQNYESFEHWKSLVKLICYSDEAINMYPNMYVEFVSDVYFQMTHVPEDLFTDIVTSNNILYTCLQRFINNVQDQANAESRLKNKVNRFSAFLASKFGWDFEDIGEDAPVVVELGNTEVEQNCEMVD